MVRGSSFFRDSFIMCGPRGDVSVPIREYRGRARIPEERVYRSITSERYSRGAY